MAQGHGTLQLSSQYTLLTEFTLGPLKLDPAVENANTWVGFLQASQD